MSKFEQGPEQRQMEMPALEIREEKGISLLSAMLKGHNADWGEQESELAIQAKTFFQQHPLNQEMADFLSNVQADEETLYNIALTYGNEQRNSDLFEFLAKNKGDVEEPEKLRSELIELLTKFDAEFSGDFHDSLQQATKTDIKLREEQLEETKIRIKDLLDFFRPAALTTGIKKLTILPTDFLYKRQSGSAFIFDDELIVRAHIDNPGNFEHEFLHSIINPIVDKLISQLSPEQQQKISQLGSYRLKITENYGEVFYSLLCEEFIRTYNECIEKNRQPMTQVDFIALVDDLDEKKFCHLFDKDENIKKNCSVLGINNLSEFKEHAVDYYNKFEKNDLRDIIFTFYQEYLQADKQVNFEEFVVNNFSQRIKV